MEKKVSVTFLEPLGIESLETLKTNEYIIFSLHVHGMWFQLMNVSVSLVCSCIYVASLSSCFQSWCNNVVFIPYQLGSFCFFSVSWERLTEFPNQQEKCFENSIVPKFRFQNNSKISFKNWRQKIDDNYLTVNCLIGNWLAIIVHLMKWLDWSQL